MSELDARLQEAIEAAANVPPVMSLLIDEESDSISLLLDTKRSYVGEWIKGEGGDICLYRDQETGKVIGCRLPLYQRQLMVSRIEKQGGD